MTAEVQTIFDLMDPARARAMQATLGKAATIAEGDPLPPFFHQMYFWDPQAPENLGRDGHPKVGTVIPDMGLPRRMWAGGRLEFAAALIAGMKATRLTFVEKTEHKQGRAGLLGFVTMRHDIWQEEQLCVTEWQDLVYREDPRDGLQVEPPRARNDEEICEPAVFDTTMLFRYSALTFNGHRIHYDIEYARNTERYQGLVVHGPLLAQLLMLLAERQSGGLKSFVYRATNPLMHFEIAELCWGSDGAAWVRGPDGRLCMEAAAS